MFRKVTLSIIRRFHCTHSNGICHTAFTQNQDVKAGPSWSWSQFLFYMTLWKKRHFRKFVGYSNYEIWYLTFLFLKHYTLFKSLSWFDYKCRYVFCKLRDIIHGFNETYILSRPNLKDPRISNFMKYCPLGTDLFRGKSQTNKRPDFTELVYILGYN